MISVPSAAARSERKGLWRLVNLSGPPANPPPVNPQPVPAGWPLSPKVPAFWMLVLLVLVGGWRITLIFIQAAMLYPKASTAAFVLFALYAIPFILVVREVDYLEREPLSLRIIAFVWGGVVATALANVGNEAGQELLAKLYSPEFSDRWAAAIVGPTTEETLKALGVVTIVLLARWQLNSVVDGFVYGATVGLGFQVVENFVYSIDAVGFAANGDQVSSVVAVFLVRGFLGGLWSHTMFTALVGAGIGYAVVRADRPWWRRVGAAVLAWSGAWLLHFVWNSPLLADGFGMGVPGLIGALLLKGIPGFLAVLLLLRAARRHESAYYAELLAGVEPILVAPGEVDALVTRRARGAARKYANGRAGIAAERLVRRLQRAQARLAVEISRSGHAAYQRALRAVRSGLPARAAGAAAGSARMRRCLRDLLEVRAQLRALGIDAAVWHGPEQRTALGGWSLGLALLGLPVPGLSLVALVLAGIGMLLARRSRFTPDSRLSGAAGVGLLGIALWTVVLVIRELNGA